MSGTITHLQLKIARDVPMRYVETMRAIADLGIEGDVNARAGSLRQVLLMDEETLIEFGLPPGRIRENITTRGIDLKALERGARLRAGNALLEITIPCAPCEFLDEIQPGLREKMIGQRGMLARVIEGGEIKIGDAVEVVK
jgi:MOSC domain-containing protein YiiM